MLTLFHLALIFFAGLLFSAVFSMIEAAVISQDRHRLAHLAESGVRSAKLMQSMLAQTDRLLAAILLFNNIANVMCATAATVIVTRLFSGDESIAFLTSLVVAFLILVLSEISPKITGVRYSKTISLFCAMPLRVLLIIFHPIISVANFLAKGVLAIAGIRNQLPGLREAMSVSEIKSAVRHSSRSAQADGDSSSGRHYYMIEQSLRLANMPVEKIMTPRQNIEGLNLQDTPYNIHQQLMKSERYKIPIFDGNIDNTQGFINTLDAIKIAIRYNGISKQQLQDIKTPPVFIPAAANALGQMDYIRKNGQRIAMVVDGAGRVSGLVTFSNFAAAIIGDETPPDNITRDHNGNFIIRGDFPLIQIGDIHPHIAIPEKTSASTISGLIIETFRNVPEEGDKVNVGDLTFEIIKSSDISVQLVRLKLAATSDDARAD